MIIIKIFLLLILTLGFLIFSFSLKLKNFQILGVIFGYIILFFFILNPQYSDKVVNYFGIGLGVNLIIYITLAVLSLVNIILFVDTKKNKDAITKITRKMGLDNAKRCE